MKLHRLEIEGFGPFRRRQVVDFDVFVADGIFLIAGRTGAGKSSVLDAVCFALYGSAPRYDGVEKSLRSDHCEPGDTTEVVLEFSAGDRRYRIERAPEYQRPKTRGEGMTTEKARAALSESDGSEWRGLASKLGEVGALIVDEIVGLSRDQFLQVILLAQGRFARFLLAKNDERQALLRTLFGSTVYRDYEALLEEQRRAATQRLEAGAAELSLLLDDAQALAVENDLGLDAHDDAAPGAAARLDRLERCVRRADYRVEQARHRRAAANEAYAVADDAHHARVSLRGAQLRRAELRDELHALEERRGDVSDRRLRLRRAERAEVLRAYLDACDAAATREVPARDLVESRRSALREVGIDTDTDTARLRALDDEWTGVLAVAAEAADGERSLTELEARANDAEQRIAAAGARRDELEHDLAALRERLPLIDTEIGRLGAVPEQLDGLRADADEAATRIAAARDAEHARKKRQSADQKHADAARDHAAATAEVAALLQRRLAGMAGELADALVDGEPCRVCGATEHPHPAVLDDEQVTDDTVARAEAEAVAAGERVQRAMAAVRDAENDLVAARERSGGRSVDDLTARRATLVADVASAEKQLTRRNALMSERRALVDREADAVERLAALVAELDHARHERATATEHAARTRAEVTAARGAYATVAARISAVVARREATRSFLTAHDEHVRCRDVRQAAEDTLATKLAVTEFATSSDATEALLDAAARTELDESIRAHDRDISAHREMLRVAEIDLAGAPDQIVETADSEAAVVAADRERTAAIAAETAATGVARMLQDRVRRATTVHAASGSVADEHRRITALADAVSGRNTRRMDLETFVLAAQLEQIVEAANRRLDEMSDGRYRLRHTDAVTARGSNGLGLAVMDAYTAQSRPPQSLSGGETFLASLALALGLAETVTARAGGLRLDTLFVDEGFGSLDAETLDTAMRTVDELRQGGRTVGLISHVEAMREQIPAQVRVRADAHGPSVISQEEPAQV